MKKQLLILAVGALVVPALAQTTNRFPVKKGDRAEMHRPDWKNGEHGTRMRKDHAREMDPEKKAEMQERRLELMKKTLKEIGVTEDQRKQIFRMQQMHQELMKANFKKVNEARNNLSELENSGASKEKIYAAIDAMSAIQSEQMKILVRNRMEMERILGKEKYRQFMDVARKQYRQHGRHGGSGMPPRPRLQDEKENGKKPPLPETSCSGTCPPVPSV